MTQYSAEVQRILSAPLIGWDGQAASDEVWARAENAIEGWRGFWWGCRAYGTERVHVITSDAATATQFRDQLEHEDYVALMKPWWKATGCTDAEIRALGDHDLYVAVRDAMLNSSFSSGPTMTIHEELAALHGEWGTDEDVDQYAYWERLGAILARMTAPQLVAAVNESKMSGRAPRRATLEEAANLIDGDRNSIYGEPLDNHKRIADLWAAGVFGHPITPAQVAIAMALVKVARLVHTPDHHDSYVDGAAYLAIADELRDA